MTVVARPWLRCVGARSAARVDFGDEATWSQRLWSDRQRAARTQTEHLLAVTAAALRQRPPLVDDPLTKQAALSG